MDHALVNLAILCYRDIKSQPFCAVSNKKKKKKKFEIYLKPSCGNTVTTSLARHSRLALYIK